MNGASGLTFLELTAASAVVAFLILVLFRDSIIPREGSLRTQATSVEMSIMAAMESYKAEYGKYPANSSGLRDTLWGDPVRGASLSPAPIDNSHLFNVLRDIPDPSGNKDHQGNPRRVIFYQGMEVRNPSSPKSGFHNGAFFDPWGTQYFVIEDTNSDHHIQVDSIYKDFQGKLPETEIGIFSFGRDRQLGSPAKGMSNMYQSGDKISDDVISWQ